MRFSFSEWLSGKEELERVDADEARCHASIEAVPAVA